MRLRIILMLSLAVVLASLAGCAARSGYSYPGCDSFTDENVSALHVGMSHEDVIAVFGTPDEQYVSEFGADVGDPWTGRALVYFTELDTSLEHVKRYKKNVLVFHPSEGDMKLNHWELEQ